MKVLPFCLTTLLVWHSISFAEVMSSQDIKTCYYQSYGHEIQKRYADAIADLKPVYLNYPNTYTINYRLGWLFYLNQNYANAMKHLNQATVIAPQSSEVLLVIIYIYQAQANWDKVETTSVQILKQDYYNIDGNYWYANALKMQGKYSLAIKIANKMLALKPTSITFLQVLGENLFLSDYIEDSLSVFNNLLILSPQDPTALYYLNQIDTLNKKENSIYGNNIHNSTQKNSGS